MALGYAAISLVILAIFLPVAMVSAQRKAQQANNHPSGYVVKGGSLSLVIVTIIGIIIITAQLLQMIGIIPAVG